MSHFRTPLPWPVSCRRDVFGSRTAEDEHGEADELCDRRPVDPEKVRRRCQVADTIGGSDAAEDDPEAHCADRSIDATGDPFTADGTKSPIVAVDLTGCERPVELDSTRQDGDFELSSDWDRGRVR